MNNVLFSSDRDDWETPFDLYKKLNDEFNFTLDPCCTVETAKCSKYFTASENGLFQTWENETVFCNPPYGKKISDWVKKCYNEHMKHNITVVMLIPARTDTRYFHDYIYNQAEIRFLKGRIKFLQNGKILSSAPFPSMIVIWKRRENNDL